MELNELNDKELEHYYHLYKNAIDESKRAENVKINSYDTKYAMHVVRLLLEAEQILAECDLDIRRHKEQLKSIRRGEWDVRQIKEWAQNKEKQLEELYAKSSLPSGPDKNKIKTLLIECLEIHYGSLKETIVQPDKSSVLLREIKEQIERAGI